MKLTLTVCITFCMTSAVLADPTSEALHPIAHIGGSYMITHISEVICRRGSSQSKLVCTAIGAGLAVTAGMAAELTQKETVHRHGVGVAEDFIGAGLAAAAINLDF